MRKIRTVFQLRRTSKSAPPAAQAPTLGQNSLSSAFKTTKPDFNETDSALVSLPPEIIDCIAQHLDLDDLRSFRAACRALNEKSFHYFSHAYFERASTNLSLTSLRRLHDISKSEWATKHVQVLKLDWDEAAGFGLTWQRDASGAVLAELSAIQQLCHIVDQLPNCQSIHVRAAYEIEPDVESTSTDVIGYSDVLGICFILIARSNLRLRSFNLDFGRSGGSVRVKHDLIHAEQTTKPAFKAAWSTLEELSLRVWVARGPSQWIMDLVSDAAHLKKFSSVAEIDGRIHLDVDSFAHIQALHLETACIDQSHLTALLHRCRGSLRTLEICNFRVQGHWIPVLECARDDSLHLESISLKYLKDGDRRLCRFTGLSETADIPDAPGRRFQLTKRGFSDNKKVVGVAYSGPGIPSVLNMLIRTINEPASH